MLNLPVRIVGSSDGETVTVVNSDNEPLKAFHWNHPAAAKFFESFLTAEQIEDLRISDEVAIEMDAESCANRQLSYLGG